MAQDIATSLHDLSRRLHPTQLGLIGLVPALDRLCSEVSRTGITVAFTHDDWEKRLRELRELGWRYRWAKRSEDGRVRVMFILEHWEPWPDDPARAIREAERMKRRT